MVATALAPTRVWQELASGKISFGRALESDLSADSTIEQIVWEQAVKEHAAFWHVWAPWRHALPGALGGSFNDIVRMFRMEEQLVAYMNLGSGVTVVDLGCGKVWMARFLPRTTRYVGVDSHLPTVAEGRRELAQLGLTGDIVEHNLLSGLPEAVTEAVRQAEEARILARWALYLPMRSIVKIVQQAFDAGARDFHIDQLTAGKFNPPSLLVHFVPFLAKGLARKELSRDQVARAVKALARMLPYGLKLKRIFPLWSSDQIAEALEGSGCRVEVLERPLWGQTTFLRVTRPA